MKTKKCTKCGKVKTLSEFGKHSITKDGFSYWCKACVNTASRRWSRTPAGIYSTLKAQGKFYKKGKTDMKRNEFIDWYFSQEKKCAYCDIPEETLHDVNDVMLGKTTRLEIDRINNDLGYALKNIVLACKRCNAIKNDYFSFSIMREIGQKYIKPIWTRKLIKI